MTTPHKFYIAGLVTMLAIAVVAGVAWMKAHDAYLNATAEAKTQAAIRQHLEQDAQQASQKFNDIGKTAETKVNQVKVDAAKPLTTEQFKALLKGLLPHVDVMETTGPGNIPLISVPDTPEVRAEIQQQAATCQIAGIERDACKQQQVELQKQLTDWKSSAQSWQAESGKWEQAAKGHTGFWKGLRSDALKVGISFGLGYALGHR